jgi:hypothetical protein
MDMDRSTGLDCRISVDTCSLYRRILNWIMLMGRGIVYTARFVSSFVVILVPV